MQKKIHFLDISVVIPMRNASSTIIETLESIKKQIYPIKEIIIVDNASPDNSVEVVRRYSKMYKKMPIRLLLNERDMMIARSLSRGVHAAKSTHIILMHADCRLVSAKEIERLVKPFTKDSSLVATYGRVIQPLSIWYHYSFWEQFLFAFQAGKTMSGLVGKIDCIKKSAYLRAGGHDTVGHDNYGGEDADLHARLRKIGKTQATTATTEHLHYMYGNFSFKDLLEKKQQTAGAYGVLLHDYGLENGFIGIITFIFKPVLALGLLLPFARVSAFCLLIVMSAVYYHRMFLTRSTLLNPRILVLPFAILFLVYFETFWTFVIFTRAFFINKYDTTEGL